MTGVEWFRLAAGAFLYQNFDVILGLKNPGICKLKYKSHNVDTKKERCVNAFMLKTLLPHKSGD